MDLSIIVVSWNTRDLLQQCLLSVHENIQAFRPAYIQTLVVDNASTDGSAAMVRNRFPWVHLIENDENVGFARANNQGIRQSDGRHFLLLNSDTIVPPGSLAPLVAFMAAHSDIAALGCQLLNQDGSPQGSYADFPGLLSAWLGTDFRRHVRAYANTDAVEVDAISGACMMVRREAVEQVGPLDERYALFAEEVDWCYCFKKGGWRVCWLPHVEIVHLLGQSRKHRSWFAYLHLHRSRMLFFRKHYGPLQAQVLRAGYLAVAFVKMAAGTLKLLAGDQPQVRAKVAQNRRLLRWLLFEQDILCGQPQGV